MWKRISVVVLLLVSGFANSQRYHLDQGDDYYKQRLYKEAIAEYKLALEQDVVVNKFYMTQQIARTYRELFDYENAEVWYAKLINLGNENGPENYLAYAQILRNNEKYKEAARIMEMYITKAKAEDRVKALRALTAWPLLHPDSMWDMTVTRTNIETGSRSMGQDLYKDQLYVGMPVISDFDETTSWYDLATVKRVDSVTFEAPVKLKGETNRSFYEGTPCLSADGKYLYYTANASEVTKYRQRKIEKKDIGIAKSGENILKIYRAENVGGEWKNVLELNINSSTHNTAFPRLSADGSKLYFASDREGSIGGFDIYVADKMNDSVWNLPKNMGDGINTPFDEMYPYENDTALFYSSKGLPGYGGSDVFYALMDGGAFGKPQNMGKPVNSSKDDFAFIIEKNTEGLYKGYLSSNREGTHGYDHVYYFAQNPWPVFPDTIHGVALNKITLKPIKGVQIELVRKSKGGEEIVLETDTDETGEQTFILDKNVGYRVTFSYEGFKPVVVEVPETDRDDVMAKFGAIKLEPIAQKNTIVQIPNIYFDFDKASIREESFGVLDNIVQYLNDNPDIRVELSAHTDSRGSDYYNLKLSQRRAQSTVDYLVNKGIPKSRLVPKGYGEKKLNNHCKNGVKCSDEEHEANRRVEMKVL